MKLAKESCKKYQKIIFLLPSKELNQYSLAKTKSKRNS
jgi:hypothetical protein